MYLRIRLQTVYSLVVYSGKTMFLVPSDTISSETQFNVFHPIFLFLRGEEVGDLEWSEIVLSGGPFFLLKNKSPKGDRDTHSGTWTDRGVYVQRCGPLQVRSVSFRVRAQRPCRTTKIRKLHPQSLRREVVTRSRDWVY